jgi:hypothetical protein
VPVASLTVCARPGGAGFKCCRVAVQLHSFVTPTFDLGHGHGHGHGGASSVSRCSRARGRSVRGCDVVSSGIGGAVLRCGAMASTRKLPKLQGTLFKYGSKPIQVAALWPSACADNGGGFVLAVDSQLSDGFDKKD